MGDGLEKDQRMLEVVTEGLRAGPGTVAWDEAVRAVGGRGAGEVGGESGGEMELLMGVRRSLQSGRRWREVRAADGFTHKLMSRLESQPKSGGGVPLTSWIIGLAMVGVVGVAIWGLAGLLGGDDKAVAGRPDASGATAGASGAVGSAGPGDRVVSYASPIVAWNFAATWPSQTAVFGVLANRAGADGWGPLSETTPGGEAVGASGAGVAAWLDLSFGGNSVAAGAAGGSARSAIEVVLKFPPSGGREVRNGRHRESPVVTHVFLTTAETLDGRLGTSPGGTEWALQLDADGMRVATGAGDVVAVGGGASTGGVNAGGVPSGTVVVLLEVSPGGSGQTRSVSVSVAGERVWSGAMGVGDLPVRVGVRFLSRGEGMSGSADVQPAEMPRAVSLRLFESR